MRRMVLGGLAALALGGVAQAADYVVVASTEPAILRGTELASGAMLSLGVGKSVVVVNPAGQVTKLNGAAGGVRVPAPQKMASANAEKMAVLKMLVAQPRVKRGNALGEKPPCPDTGDLTSLEPIFTSAQVDGCLSGARAAFTAYVEKKVGPLEAPVP